MTQVLITVDTELSFGSHKRGVDLEANLEQSIFGKCAEGSFGIGYQIERLNAHGLRGVFMIDPLPARTLGLEWLRRTVATVLEGGQEVQLHIHPAWSAPPEARASDAIGTYALDEQLALLNEAIDLLTAVGAPRPIAFRAGNYEADERTLTALARLGLRYDSSFNPIVPGACRLELPTTQVEPVEYHGLLEVPVSALHDRPGGLRHAQLCAVSAWELRAALLHAAAVGQSVFTLVSHSFELLSRDRKRANRTVVARFEALLKLLADERERLPTVGFEQLHVRPAASPARLRPNLLRTVHRMGEQALANWRYERA